VLAQMRSLALSRVTLGLVVLSGVIVAGVLGSIATLSGGNDDAQPVSTTSAVRRPVKLVIAGTNDAKEEVTDGGIAGEGKFTATGAVTDHGTVRAYRWLSVVDPRVIFLRFVTKGRGGAIAYLVRIDTTRRPVIARWTIESASRRYRGLHGKGTESENAAFTVSTLRGRVWR
jgi:hypothetical protein